LAAAGFIAADDEAQELLAYATGDDVILESSVVRRLSGEPLAWIVGFATFCGMRINVDHGVYVPRWQSEPLAERAASRLPGRGTALDVCTGSGAIAATLRARRPHARVLATDLDQRSVTCAKSNGVEVYNGDLFAPLPLDLEGRVDVIVAVVPYVPTSSLDLLPRDTFVFESTLSYDGGTEGVDVLRRVMSEGRRFLRCGGSLLVELGGEQAEALQADVVRLGFEDVTVFFDDDGDVRGLEATLAT
jgi:release factor glutamine methyltransferase